MCNVVHAVLDAVLRAGVPLLVECSLVFGVPVDERGRWSMDGISDRGLRCRSRRRETLKEAA